MKKRLIEEGANQLYENIVQLKMKAHDGKMSQTDLIEDAGSEEEISE